MKISIGSKTTVKVNALKEILKEYPDFKNAEVVSIDTDSKVSEQPKTLEETMQGAINRAKAAFQNSKGVDFSFGVEAGLSKIPNTKTGYMNLTVCVIFDGKDIHVGLSSGFEYPIKVTELVFKEGLDINQAFHKVGLTKDPKIGSSSGAIGFLTKNRLPRKEYVKESIRTALIHLENKEHY